VRAAKERVEKNASHVKAAPQAPSEGEVIVQLT
jgi:hypothetical protein